MTFRPSHWQLSLREVFDEVEFDVGVSDQVPRGEIAPESEAFIKADGALSALFLRAMREDERFGERAVGLHGGESFKQKTLVGGGQIIQPQFDGVGLDVGFLNRSQKACAVSFGDRHTDKTVVHKFAQYSGETVHPTIAGENLPSFWLAVMLPARARLEVTVQTINQNDNATAVE